MSAVTRCAGCGRPRDRSGCPRCEGDVDGLTRALMEAGGGRLLFVEAYALAKRVAERESAAALFLDATAQAFAA